MKYYFDTEDGPSKDTSHPNFIKHMSAEFYYDCTDEFSPFGNDDGAEILYALEDVYKEETTKYNILEWMFNEIDELGFKYQSKECSEIFDLEVLNRINDDDEYLISAMDNSIIATGFGQIKITGEIDADLKEITLKALARQILLDKENNYLAFNDRLNKMKHDLLNFE